MSDLPYDESQLRRYPIELQQIPKLSHDDPKIDEYIASNVRNTRRKYKTGKCISNNPHVSRSRLSFKAVI